VERNDAAALRAFLDSDPGDFREEAQTALAELEERTYEGASDTDTVEVFEAFLNDFPESEHAIAVRGRIAELRTATPVQQAAPPPPSDELADPDLLPPGAAPETSGGPAPLTPPAEPPPEAPPAAPTN
jgi:hypothetical protein